MKFLIFVLLFFVGAKCQQPPDCNQVYLIFIGTSLTDTVKVSLTSDLAPLRKTVSFQYPLGLSSKYFDPSKKTVMYTNGWRLNYNSDDAKAILGNYIAARRSEYNLVYVDWSAYTNNFVYLTSLGAMLGTSQTTYKIMKRLTADPLINFDATKTHMIGYDLGAHFLHMVASEVSWDLGKGLAFENLKVNRLTGLDPAGMFQFGPFMFAFFSVKAIAKATAAYTDVIHTSMNKFGIGGPSANLDFYPNYGETQPGCTAKKSIQDFLANQDINQIDHLCCSHSRGWELYAESILRDSTVFQSVYCYPFQVATQSCNVNDPSKLSMGYWAFDKTKWPAGFELTYNLGLGFSYAGDFYVQTNAVSPYSMT